MKFLRFIPVKYQIAFGQVTIVITTALILISMGIGPDSRQATLRGRQRLCESIAINSSMHLSQNDLKRIEGLLSAMVQRDPQLLSAAIRRADGKAYVEIGQHAENWLTNSQFSTDAQVHVPLLAGKKEWGSVELRFQSLRAEGLAEFIANPWTKLLVLLATIAFVLFSVYLQFTLNQLDPKKAIPKRVQFALDNIAEGLIVTDGRGRVLLANESFAAWAGKRSEKLIGSDATGFPWRDPDSGDGQSSTPIVFPWLLALERQKAQPNFPMSLTDCNDNELTLMAHASPLLGNDGRYRGVLTSFEDITALEHHKIELSIARDAADDANQAKSEFLARMSHEIRTPMNAILGYTEVLRRGFVDNESQRDEHLATIQNSGQHLLALINDILDLSKIEAGKMEVELTRVSPLSVIAQVISVLKIKADENEIYLVPEFPTKIPEMILTDAVRLRQAIINLVGNAIKFTQQGGVRVVTRLTSDEIPMLAIDVIDSGIGMTPEALEKIFEPFSQADSSISRRFGGTGLGLSISVQLAEKLGGELSVQSEQGVGSVFTFTFDPGPLDGVPCLEGSAIDLDAFVRHEAATQQTQQLCLPASRILVVDDGEANRRLVGLYLKRAGVEVFEAVNGQEAVELASQYAFDVILMDMHMPVMDGFDATRKLRENGYAQPVIALTADVMKDDERKCREAGCTGFLTKPIGMDRLLKTLADALGGNVEVVESEPEQQLHNQVSELQRDVDAVTPIVSSLPMDDIDFREIVELFLVRLKDKIAAMHDSLTQSNFENLAELGHWLKGAGGTVGFELFTAPAEAMESSALSRDLAGVQRNLDKIEDIQSRIIVPSSQPKQPAVEPLHGGTTVFSSMELLNRTD